MTAPAEHGEVLAIVDTAGARELAVVGRHQKKKRVPRCDGAERKREVATGSLAIVASGQGPSHPRSTFRGPRLRAISRGEPQVDVGHLHRSCNREPQRK